MVFALIVHKSHAKKIVQTFYPVPWRKRGSGEGATSQSNQLQVIFLRLLQLAGR